MAGRETFTRLDEAATRAIGRLFGTEPQVEPYSPDGSPVYSLTMRGAADGIRMVIWPSLARVDVSSTGNHGWVIKDVASVEVIDGVEVVFRTAGVEGYLFVSVNGWVNMVVG